MATKARLSKSKQPGFQNKSSPTSQIEGKLFVTSDESSMVVGLKNIFVVAKQPREVILRLIDCLKEV